MKLNLNMSVSTSNKDLHVTKQTILVENHGPEKKKGGRPKRRDAFSHFLK
jgi:hypothetical protein